MMRRVVQVAPMAALLTIGMPEPSAKALEFPSLQSDEMMVLVREGGRGGGDNGGSRGGRGDGDSSSSRGGRESRRPGNDTDWFGFRPRQYDDRCEGLRPRASDTGSNDWRRYRACTRG